MEEQPIEYKQTQLYLVLGIVTIVVLALSITIISTSFIWIPILILFSPVLAIIYLVLQYTKLGDIAHGVYYNLYDWLFYKSDKPRQFLWGLIYNAMCLLYPNSQWRAMNYGFACLTSDGFTIKNLEEKDQEERFCLQLYHFLATKFHTIQNIKGLRVLEVGSGRGGGLSYISRYLNPSECVGVDLSQNQVEFCQQTYESNNQLQFYQGDSQNVDQIIQLQEGSFDMAINVESSHCYGNFRKFVDQVYKFLKPKGFFAFTDFRTLEEIPNLMKDLKEAGFKIVKDQEITVNVLTALKLDEQRRTKLIDGQVFAFLRPFFRQFSGVSGTRIYEEFNSRKTIYKAFILEKP